ncbi:MAG: EAL domain-containing protein [Deltaproteobacteria bacterium]|nr:EAL domain-containing protein [Deltaproteobacteria bacterium]MBW2394336.1 EAL domain-containing protein [Deltaproteobacteria bacterium]
MEDLAKKRPRVLVVDDDPSVRRTLGRALDRDGLEPVIAPDGQAALRAFDECAPQLVLLDVQMPGMSGFEVCEALRARPDGDELPIVMMTGMEDLQAIQNAYDAGATDFVTKPIQWLVLSHRLRYLLRAGSNLRRLHETQERVANAQRLAQVGSWELELETGHFTGSDVLWEIYGIERPDTASGLKTLTKMVHPADRDHLQRAVQSCFQQNGPVRFDHRMRRGDGSERVLHCQIQMNFDPDGCPMRMEGIAQDLTERKRTEEQVRFLSSHDALTSLGNRRLFRERLDLAIRQARQSGWKAGILYLDLDHFKRINETLGHSIGDSLLAEVANRLVMSVRGADLVTRGERAEEIENSAISRLGGDEFSILLPRVRDVQSLAAVARRILNSLEAPFSLAGHEVVVGGSVGITVYPNDGEDPETLLRNADTAMYAAKEQGRNTYQFYAESMNELSLRRLILEGKLRRALEESQFELYYQPKVDLASGDIVGFEGLLRWHEPELGMVGPADFIPVAEEMGLITSIGEWVLQAACKQAADWARRGVCTVPVAVNLSPEQFRKPGLAKRIAEIVHEAGISPEVLDVEITEGVVLHDADLVIRELKEIRALGMHVALDDFGTGYSSLSYLRRLPVDTLKIDRAFIKDIENQPEDAALTQGIIALGRALGLHSVAEGVETEAQRAQLAAWKCDQMQGYLFSKPLPVAELEELWERVHAKDRG